MKQYWTSSIFAFFMVACAGSPSALAITFEHTNFISSPTFFNGFEEFGTTGIVAGSSYSEGGITVTANGLSAPPITSDTSPWGGSSGLHNWYSGGVAYEVSIKLTGGGQFQDIQFQVSSGSPYGTFLGGALRLNGSLLYGNSVGLNAYCCQQARGYEFHGFSGGGFDEVLLAVSSPLFFPLDINEIALDSISATAATPTPIPGALPLFASGLGLLAFWSRKRKVRTTVT